MPHPGLLWMPTLLVREAASGVREAAPGVHEAPGLSLQAVSTLLRLQRAGVRHVLMAGTQAAAARAILTRSILITGSPDLDLRDEADTEAADPGFALRPRRLLRLLQREDLDPRTTWLIFAVPEHPEALPGGAAVPAAGGSSGVGLLSPGGAAVPAAGGPVGNSNAALTEAIATAVTAGLAGLVLIGPGALPQGDPGIVLAEATGIADVPRVLIPRGGGCWHAAPTRDAPGTA